MFLLYPMAGDRAMAARVDYEAAGLLAGLSGERWRERLALLNCLSAAGVGLSEMKAAQESDALLFVGAERVVGGGNDYTLAQVAQASGLELPFLVRVMAAFGLAVPAPDDPVYGPGDLELAKIVAAYSALGLPAEDLLEVARALGRALAPLAETLGRIALERARAPGAGEEELARRWMEVTGAFAPLLDPLLGRALGLHLRNHFRSAAVSQVELSSVVFPAARPVAVAFTDLVGFTSAGERLDPVALTDLAFRLEELGSSYAQGSVRLVKALGDGLMLVSGEVAALLAVVLTLVAEAGADPALPPLRAGVAFGEAVPRAADWFGQPVNLASRLCSLARPGAVLSEKAVRERAGRDRFRFSAAGRRRLKGVAQPCALYRVRFAA